MAAVVSPTATPDPPHRGHGGPHDRVRAELAGAAKVIAERGATAPDQSEIIGEAHLTLAGKPLHLHA